MNSINTKKPNTILTNNIGRSLTFKQKLQFKARKDLQNTSNNINSNLNSKTSKMLVSAFISAIIS